jgi:hypothetical protein
MFSTFLELWKIISMELKAYKWDYPHLWPPFDPISPSWAYGQNVKVQVLECNRDLSTHKDSSRLHFGHIWHMHIRCVSGFLKLCHTFLGWGYIFMMWCILMIFFLGRHLGCFEHFVFMCNSLIDVLPNSLMDSNVSLNWKQRNNKESGHVPWLIALWKGRRAC